METAFLAVLIVIFLGMGLRVRRYGRTQGLVLLAVASSVPFLVYLTW